MRTREVSTDGGDEFVLTISELVARKYYIFLQPRPSPVATPLLKLAEKAPVCKNRSENFLHGAAP